MNYYQILGVTNDATFKDIRKSYYKLAKKLHPDKNGNELKFKELNQAYVILIDEEKRRMYDYKIKPNINLSNEKPYDVVNEILNKYNLNFLNNILSDVYGNKTELADDVNNLDVNNIYKKFKNYYKLDIEKTIHLDISDILNKKVTYIDIVRKVGKIKEKKSLEIGNVDIYDSELIYENLGNEIGNFKGNLIVKIVINESNFFEVGDNYDLVANLDDLNKLDKLGINFEVNDKKFLFENEKNLIYIIKNNGFYDYENNKYGNFYIKINK